MIKYAIAAFSVSAMLLPMAAQAAITVYTVDVSAAQEVPVNGSPANGTFQLALDDVANTLSFAMSALGLQGTVTGAHIHEAMAGANGPVVFALTADGNVDGGGLIGPFPGSIFFFGTNKSVDGDVVAGINAAPWNYYVNLHTEAFPGGEIRGQLAPIPEVSTYAMLAMGLGVLGLAARRRRTD